MAEQITLLLLRWSDGDKSAFDQLLPLVYDELRRQAKGYLRRHADQNSLQATALVHEAYLRLVNQEQVTWKNRAQFFGLAAKVMRGLLVDHARAAQADKRGGSNLTVSLSEADRIGEQKDYDLVALDQALDKLATLEPRHCQIIEMRFFAGLTIEETAVALGVSHATIERDWSLARAWLYRELS